MIAFFSSLNAILSFLPVKQMLVFSLGITQILYLLRGQLTPDFTISAIILTTFFDAIFIFLGAMTLKGRLWPIIVGCCLYFLDTLVFVFFRDFIAIIAHLFFLYIIIRPLFGPVVRKLKVSKIEIRSGSLFRRIVKNQFIQNILIFCLSVFMLYQTDPKYLYLVTIGLLLFLGAIFYWRKAGFRIILKDKIMILRYVNSGVTIRYNQIKSINRKAGAIDIELFEPVQNNYSILLDFKDDLILERFLNFYRKISKQETN
jgi:hypothetical protein